MRSIVSVSRLRLESVLDMARLLSRYCKAERLGVAGVAHGKFVGMLNIKTRPLCDAWVRLETDVNCILSVVEGVADRYALTAQTHVHLPGAYQCSLLSTLLLLDCLSLDMPTGIDKPTISQSRHPGIESIETYPRFRFICDAISCSRM